MCALKPGSQYVNEDFQSLSGKVVKEVHWNKIAVFHYVTRRYAGRAGERVGMGGDRLPARLHI